MKTDSVPQHVVDIITDGYFAAFEGLCPYEPRSNRWTATASVMLWKRGFYCKTNGVPLAKAVSPDFSFAKHLKGKQLKGA